MVTREKNSVLVIDDDPANIIALQQILSPEFTIYGTTDGASAVKVATESSPDIILLDVVMPVMNGYEVISLLKSTEATREIPVIFVTGLTGDEYEEQGLEAGAEDYITKPFSPVLIRLRVRNLMKLVNRTREINIAEFNRKSAEHSSRVKSEFLSRMSHEMLTPMNAIMGYAEIAKRSNDIDKIGGLC